MREKVDTEPWKPIEPPPVETPPSIVKPWRHVVSKIIFLDIDGVLNAHEFDPDAMCGKIHPEKISILNGVLRETGAKIVLSSAWRYIIHRGESTLVGMEWLMRSHGMIAGVLVGITRRDTMEKRMEKFSGNPCEWPVENERGAQISDWIESNKVTSYVAVDDLDLGITAAGHPLVQTDGKIGITTDHAAKMVAILGKSEGQP